MATSPHVEYKVYDSSDRFTSILGGRLEVKLLADASAEGKALYHEACIYHKSSRSVFVTSNQLQNPPAERNEATSNKHIRLYRIYDDDTLVAKVQQIVFPGWEHAMLNGGVNFGPQHILMCAQGTKDSSHLAGLIALAIAPETKFDEPKIVLSSFHDIPFNSVNDVIVHPKDNSIWFTDPCYGYHQGIRNPPQLPNQVYRHEPNTGVTRIVADGFTRPNGRCFSPDLKTLYITDTGGVHGSSTVPFDPTGPSHIYAYNVEYDTQTCWLTNKRLFAFAPGRCPDGIKCDTNGNVYSGCGDGIEVWSEQGIPLGVIKVPGGVANFCFGDEGVIYACNETKFWKVEISKNVKGALLDGMTW